MIYLLYLHIPVIINYTRSKVDKMLLIDSFSHDQISYIVLLFGITFMALFYTVCRLIMDEQNNRLYRKALGYNIIAIAIVTTSTIGAAMLQP